MNIYTIHHYNLNTKTDKTFEISAKSAISAVQKAAQRLNFASFTRKNQCAKNKADRDNAYAQADSAGLVGWSACRKGRESFYKNN